MTFKLLGRLYVFTLGVVMVMMVMMVKEGVASIAIIVGVVAASIVGVAIARDVGVSSVVWVTTEVRLAWDATFV